MKILINEGGEKGKRITIMLPTSLVLNRFTAAKISEVAKKYKAAITKEQVMSMTKVIKKYKKTHKDWLLADIESGNGEKVKIKL